MRQRGHLAGAILLSAGLLSAAAAPALATTHVKSTNINTKRIGSVHTNLGRVLSNSKGRVMYLLTKDKHGVSHCTGACAGAWPHVTSKTKPVAGAGVSAKHLRRNAKHQVTYYGHPLYYFISDTKRGKHSGEGAESFYLVSTHGKAVKPKKKKPTGPTGPTGPSGPAEVTTGTVDAGSTEVLTGSNGHTLYELSDESGSPAYFYCTGGCTGTWIPLLTKGAPTAAGDAESGMLSTATRPDDGFSQVTYNNHPLYYYKPDTAAGQNGGEGRPFPPSAYWYELGTDGNPPL